MPENEAPQTIEEPTEETPVVEKKDEATPLTTEQFSVALAELVTRAKAAGLRPAQMMISAYVKQSMSVVDGILGALDGNQKKKDQ
tara:strand:+ start:15813 stop:16067 length:255 start_codon:yes stop_codon:yes gene_type:complete